MDPAGIETRIESVRYALLRRLAFALRHHVARHLQPIGMMTEVMDRRLDSPAPDIAQLHESLAKINVQARAAVQSSLDVVAWLAPEAGKLVALDACVAECVEMLRSYLAFRGFALRAETNGVAEPVPQSAVRSVVPAALLALTDRHPSPADVLVSVQREESRLVVSIQLKPSNASPGFPGELHYRAIEWADVEAIAGTEGVLCASEPQCVRLAFRA